MTSAIMARLGLDAGPYKAGLRDAKSETDRFGSNFGSAMSMVKAGAIGAAVAIVGIGASVISVGRNAIKAADDIKDMADALGLTSTALQEFQQAFAQNGTGAEKFNKGFTKFLDTLSEARKGTESAIEKFTDLGISVNDLAGLSPEEIFYKVSDGLEDTEDKTERLNRSLALFGKSGREMNILLSQGSAAVKQAMSESIVASQAAINNLAQVQDKIEAFGNALKAIAIEVTNFILNGFKTLASQIQPYVDMLKPYLQSLGAFQIGGNSISNHLKGAGMMMGAGKGSEAAPIPPGEANDPSITPAKDEGGRGGQAVDPNAEANSAFQAAVGEAASYGGMSSSARGALARENRKGDRSENRANRRYGVNERGTIENPEGAARALRDHKRGRIQLSPEEQSRLEGIANGTLPAAGDQSGDPTKQTETGTAPVSTELTELQAIRKACEGIESKYGTTMPGKAA
jgi:hypothetical protein